jgi:hypothetical protein
MDTMFYTCWTVDWVLSRIATAASMRSGQSALASCETLIQETLQLLVSQVEFIEVVLLRFLVVDLVPLMFIFQKNLAYLQQVELSERLTSQWV